MTIAVWLTQTQSTTLDVATARCVAPTPTTPTTPTTTTSTSGGTLPATGGGLTWVIGAIAGLVTTPGAALFAGTRRSRVD
ncbi:MAG: hypothetical protein M3431_10325 [Actinomycetota bacterium]|nr:hypothetical protein [Actinomycetota bacterium]